MPGCRALLRSSADLPPRHLYLDPPHREQAITHLQRIIYLMHRRLPAWKLQTKTAFLDFLFDIGMNETIIPRSDQMLGQTHFLNSLDHLEKNIQHLYALQIPQQQWV